MIQVIERAFRILELLAKEEPLELRALAEKTGQKKPTLCVQLKTLSALGYIQQNQRGEYEIGPKLHDIAFPSRKRNIVIRVAERLVPQLSGRLRESVTAAMIYHGERYTVAHTTYRQALMVDTGMMINGTFYNSATGRVLLAYLPDEQQGEIIQHIGLPGEEWPEVSSTNELSMALQAIRRDETAEMIIGQNEVIYIAMPVFGPDNKVWMSIGVSLPTNRFVGDHRLRVVNELKRAVHRAGTEITLEME
jgi:DNA-binding IclR family transcriptional regulator